MKFANKFYLLGVQCDRKRNQFVREITLLKVYDCISVSVDKTAQVTIIIEW